MGALWTQMKPTFSVIVPVFNVAPYLRMCLDSICAAAKRAFGNDVAKAMEIICVDDGSTDGGADILDDYREQYRFIRVIHQENIGLGAARNTGLEAAKGDWILFIDSDDEVTEDYFEVINGVIKQYSPDVIRLGYEEVHSLGDTRDSGGGTAYCIEVGENPRGVYGVIGSAFAWNTCYSHDKIRGIRFKNITPGEDALFNADVLAIAERVAVTSANIYHYLQREGSLMHKKSISLRQIESCGISMAGRVRNIKTWKHFDQVKHDLFKMLITTYIGQGGLILERVPERIWDEAWKIYCDYARRMFTPDADYIPSVLRLILRLIFRLRSYFLYKVLLLIPWKCRVAWLRLTRKNR